MGPIWPGCTLFFLYFWKYHFLAVEVPSASSLNHTRPRASALSTSIFTYGKYLSPQIIPKKSPCPLQRLSCQKKKVLFSKGKEPTPSFPVSWGAGVASFSRANPCLVMWKRGPDEVAHVWSIDSLYPASPVWWSEPKDESSSGSVRTQGLEATKTWQTHWVSTGNLLAIDNSDTQNHLMFFKFLLKTFA